MSEYEPIKEERDRVLADYAALSDADLWRRRQTAEMCIARGCDTWHDWLLLAEVRRRGLPDKRPPRVYLAGPINGQADADAKGWRAEAGALLGARAEAVDPMRRDYRGREHLPGVAAEIVEADKADIRASDVALFRWPGAGSVGTTMELIYAHERGRPVVVWDDRPDRSRPLSEAPWVAYHATEIVSTLAEAVERAVALAKT